MTLKANGGPIPTLRQVLDEIDGAVPLLLEVKSPKVDVEPLCEAIGRALDGYEGEFAVQSFNPMIIEWFRVHRPGFERGCTTTDYDHMDWETPEIRGLLAKAVEHEMGDPHFYAQDVNYFPNDITERAKRRNLPLVVWTVRTEEGLEKARKHGANVIFELVRP
jgi:glycerophosphoryl diester phosphodiesterase